MPGRNEILEGLTEIANRAELVAIIWHVALAVLGLALLFGRKPAARMLALGLSAPLASVALCAASFGNPFNALTFGACALVAAWLAYRSPSAPLVAAGGWPRALGVVLVAFAWVYPHFLHGPAIRYLYAAPLGTIPCPTLAAVIGIALLASGLAGGTWSALLAAVGGFYGLFGVFRLGVTIDIVLLIGSLGLGVQAWRAKTKLA